MFTVNNKNTKKRCDFTPFSTSVSTVDFEQVKALGPKPAITCSKLKIETLEQGVKYVQS